MTVSSSTASVDTKDTIYGLDLLAGIGYKFNSMFEGFFKLGGLLENTRMNRNTNINSTTVDVADNQTTTSSAVIPEVKVGGLYNIDNDWALSASYMHAFGNGDVSLNVNKTYAGTETTTATAGPISLNTILAGVVYKFD